MGKRGGVTVEFRHPRTLIDRELLQQLGQLAAQSISEHTQQGLDAQGRPMRALTQSYARIHQRGDRTRRLTRTGKMLLSARLKYERKAVSIAWTDPKAEWHQRDVGWIGLSEREQAEISKRLQRRGRLPWNRYLRTKIRRL